MERHSNIRNQATTAGPATIGSLSRGLELLTILADANELPLAEIARRAGLSKSSTHRLLHTLIQAGFVTRAEPAGHYRLGLKLLRLASSYVGTSGLEQLVVPQLEALAQHTQETVHMALLDGQVAVYVAKIDSPNAIRMYSRVGRQVPYYCTGLGKAILAHLPEAQAADILTCTVFQAHTPHTLTTAAALQRDLELIRARGYALDEEEHELGIRCIAAPLFGRNRRVSGGISITGITFRVTPEQLLVWWPPLRECAQYVSTVLEHHFP
jgi:IclR family acetate operon transcriptional repressor